MLLQEHPGITTSQLHSQITPVAKFRAQIELKVLWLKYNSLLILEICLTRLQVLLRSYLYFKFDDQKLVNFVVVENREKSLNLQDKLKQELNKNEKRIMVLTKEKQRLLGMKNGSH